MDEGWIKLHRKVLRNKIFRHDPNAWHVFECLLLIVNRNDGTWSGGRFQLAELAELKAGTTYKALKRLENAKMVTLVSNNRFTIISISKWSGYQQDGNTLAEQRGNNAVTTGEHYNKNKELRIKNNTLVEVQRTFDLFIKLFNKNPGQYKLTPMRVTKLKTRLADSGEEMLARAIKNTAQSAFHRGDNDRGWEADLDWIIKSYEQVEKLSTLKGGALTSSDGKKFNSEGDLVRYEEYLKQQKGMV